jgi:hypothetical protein
MWIGQLLKGEVISEAGQFNSTMQSNCGGQNCGMWAISEGSASGDMAPGPCGATTTDPFTMSVDYSHSYGLFQDTPACEGTFIQPALPSGYTCTATTTIGYSGATKSLPFSASDNYFYCESATGNGVMDLNNNMVKGVINAVTNPMDPQYKLSVFNPAYYFFIHLVYTLNAEYYQATPNTMNCAVHDRVYADIGYWLNGDPSKNCGVPNDDGTSGQNGGQSEYSYIQDVINNWNAMSSTKFAGPAPMAGVSK